MKKKLIVLTSLLVLSLAAVVFAFNRSQTAQSVSASCPMHQQTAAAVAGEKDSCCGMTDCCKDGKCAGGGACCKSKDSCPMKGESKADGAMNMSQVSFVVGESCCQKDAACCQGGACCGKS